METAYETLLVFVIVISPIIFFTLLFVSAPYGRHARPGWGVTIDSRWAWMWMELPAVLTIATIYLLHSDEMHIANVVFLLIWEWHYIYRTFYFPTRLHSTQKSFPILLILFATVFNLINGFLNGTYLFSLNPIEGWDDLHSWHFIIGSTLFMLGFCLHYYSDRIILHLRTDPTIHYAIPYGGGFRWVTNPNYLGEFMQWCGWAILTWSLAGFAFALFTLANLLPRAITNHKWYKRQFPDYPQGRKIFFPYVY